MVPPLCLLTLLGERFAFLFGLWGLLARNAGRPPLSLRDISPAQRGNLPTPRRKLLKKLEQNFYVFYVFSDTLCGNKKAMLSAWCSSVSPAGCRVIRRANSKYFRCHPAHSQLAASLLAALVPIGSSFFPARLRRLLRILFSCVNFPFVGDSHPACRFLLSSPFIYYLLTNISISRNCEGILMEF